MSVKKNEDAFFKTDDLHNRKTKEEAEKILAAEKARLAVLKHSYMKCPKCGGELHTKPFKHVKIDRCGHCQGVWLDHGELEQLAGNEGNIISEFLSAFK